jgi:predicted DNA-binding transcriptional regulator AlpA
MTDALTREDYLTEDDVASFLGKSKATLKDWRHKKHGPPYYKFGRTVMYSRPGLAAWVQASVRLSQGTAPRPRPPRGAGR